MRTIIIEGKDIFLRRLTEEDVTEKYVAWLNDPDINQYLESRFSAHTMEETKQFIRSVTNDFNYMFGIFTNKDDEHIGNIKIGGINPIHKYADIGFIIGDKANWGKGYATEAIRMAVSYSFNYLNLNKVWGGYILPISVQ